MNETRGLRHAAVPQVAVRRLLAIVAIFAIGALACVLVGVASADPAPVVDSQSIVRSLRPAATATRALVVEPRGAAGSGSSGAATVAGPGERKVALDVRFANDSDRISTAAHTQLEQLGAALNSPELVRSRFLIAGHTSATGSAVHNLRLSQARARAVRSYLIEHFRIAPDRIEATGYGSSRPLPEFPPKALQQRRVEISTLPYS